MSLVTLIRDYVDVTSSSEQLNGLNGSTLSSLAYYTFTFFFTVLKQAIVYCFTFHWLRDLSYFCLTPPLSFSSFTNFGVTAALHIGASGNGANGAEQAQPLSNLLAFSDSNFSNGIGIILFAFVNGCFNCLHLSAANLITTQRMLVQGVPAGLCSAFGTAIGQLSFIACVVFGFRGLLFPWLALEPLHFLLGTVILLSIASAAAQDRRTPTVQWSAKFSLLMYTFTSVVLTWCEQTALFQWMGNISFGTEPTFLETTPSLETINTVLGTAQQLTQNFGYLFAFFLGNLVGAFSFGYGLQRLLEWILRSRGIAIYYGLVKQANLPLATLVFAFGFGSLPYYGFDYLITKEFGFFPNERFFQQTLFSPTNLVSKTSQTKEPSQGRLEDQLALLFTLEGERTKSFAVDTTPFDDGQYLKASQKRPQAFEDLNYRGEHLWTNRLARISNIREQANQTQSSFLGPIFSWMRSFLWGDGPTATNTPLDKRQIPTEMSGLQAATSAYPTGKQASFTTEGGTDDISGTGGNQRSTTPEIKEELFNDTITPKAEITSDREQVDNYVKEFDRQFDKGFSNFYNADPQALIEVEDQWQEKRIKEKCYTNPIYTFLLNTEIDTFLARQPKSHLLSPQEEALLLKRRQLLTNYYDTLALTSQVSTSDVLGQLLPPLVVPKSYSNAIYNHQFKGTLKTARRLFSIKKVNNTKDISQGTLGASFASPIPPKGVSVAKQSKVTFDNAVPSLPKVESQGDNNANGIPPLELSKNKVRAVKFDQPLFSNEKKNVQQIVFHEELPTKSAQNQSITSEGGKLVDKSPNIFLLEQAEPLPLYTSWDQGLRKLILTNRYQSRAIAGYAISEFPANSINNKIAANFTTWPIPNPLSNNKKFVDTTDINTPTAANIIGKSKDTAKEGKQAIYTTEGGNSGNIIKDIKILNNILQSQNYQNRFLFQSKAQKEPATNDMIHALLQWQKVIKENKQLSTEEKQAAKEKVSYWPENVSRASWSNEIIDNDIEFDEPNENVLKKQTFLWEFTLPNHGGFIWPGSSGNR